MPTEEVEALVSELRANPAVGPLRTQASLGWPGSRRPCQAATGPVSLSPLSTDLWIALAALSVVGLTLFRKSMPFALGRPHMANRPSVSNAILVAVLALGASGCRGDDPGDGPGAQPTPTATGPTSATTTPTEPASPTATPEAWRAKFTKDQLTAYERALQVWKQYNEITGAYFRDPPKDLETVRRTYERFTYNPVARYDSYVQTVVDGGLRVIVPPEPISHSGRSITLHPKGDVVVLVQCNDYHSADYRRGGRRIEPEVANRGQTTARQRIELGSDQDGTWRILKIETVDRPCA